MLKDYKDTIILPSTTFPMRANLQANENLIYTKWYDENIYQKMQKNRETAKGFTLHDGPPYANGHLHIGHALNKVLKDFIFKIHYFNGEKSFFTPGWDCHGLPIEQQVEKKFNDSGTKKEDVNILKLREECRNHAKKFIDIQSEEFRSLGVIADFHHPYKTMDFAFEANIFKALCLIAKRGILEERSKPIYWSYAAKSALAEAEVEYEQKVSTSIFVSFALDELSLEKLSQISGTTNLRASFIIWTTTPWTLPSNVAIALSPNALYILTTDGYIMAKDLFANLKDQSIIKGEIACEFPSSKLENLTAINPLNGRESKIILGEHVSMDSGSGCVHTAPGHGEDDYICAMKYKLPVIMPVDEEGRYDVTIEKLSLFPKVEITKFLGRNIFEAQVDLINLLGAAVLKKEDITHSYPHCWRTHKPVIFRATKQWFILLDKPFDANGNKITLRDLALKNLEEVQFVPEKGRNRITSMIENRSEWCISRQRDWGVPLAFFLTEDGEILLDDEVLDFLFLEFKKCGCDIWWSRDISDLLPLSHRHLSTKLKKSMHILDVWFDSGSTWLSVLNFDKDLQIYNGGEFPSSIYLEGSDQHRGWFQSSLLISTAITLKAPYKVVLTHGFTFDQKGEKMSKSKGNVIPPKDVIRDYGSEILRLWVANSNYQSDQNIGEVVLKQMSEQYRKLRNTIRFLLANTSGTKNINLENLSVIDKWILSVASRVFAQIRMLNNEYDFAKSFQILNNFVTNELSGIYLDLIKDILYCEAIDSPKRKAIQSVLCLIANNLIFCLAPFLTYTCKEALEHMDAPIFSTTDIFSIEFAPIRDYEVDLSFYIAMRDSFLELCDRLKKQNLLKSSLELSLLKFDDEEKKLSNEELSDFLIISTNYGVKGGKTIENDFTFEDKKYSYSLNFASSVNLHKCPRCWKFDAKNEGEICKRCQEVLNV